MKSIILQTVLFVGFIFCSISFAQAQSPGAYKVHIPFDFSIGKTAYAAGNYTVEIRGLDQKFFVIRDVEGRKSHMAMTFSGDPRMLERARLDFQQIGDRYFLSSIRAADVMASFRVPETDINLGQKESGRKIAVALSKGR